LRADCRKWLAARTRPSRRSHRQGGGGRSTLNRCQRRPDPSLHRSPMPSG
jgi:hypothetical protein